LSFFLALSLAQFLSLYFSLPRSFSLSLFPSLSFSRVRAFSLSCFRARVLSFSRALSLSLFASRSLSFPLYLSLLPFLFCVAKMLFCLRMVADFPLPLSEAAAEAGESVGF